MLACYPLLLTKPCTVVSDTPSQCFLDFGDCTMHAPSELRCDGNCPVARHGDGMCDEECNNVACGFDAGDCQPPGLLPPLQKPLPPSCAPGCTAAMTQVSRLVLQKPAQLQAPERVVFLSCWVPRIMCVTLSVMCLAASTTRAPACGTDPSWARLRIELRTM